MCAIQVSGMIQFKRCTAGFDYQKTLKPACSLSVIYPVSCPEGVVCAHDSFYLADAEHGTITRLGLDLC